MQETIYCLSLTQPWATLMAIGAKLVETRSWKTSYRGLVAIHAAKGYPGEAASFSSTDSVSALLLRAGYNTVSRPANQKSTYSPKAVHLRSLPFGAIVAVGDLVDCVRSDVMRELVSKEERFLGDYADERWAWIFRDVRALPEPIPARGALKLWKPPPEISCKLLEFYAEA